MSAKRDNCGAFPGCQLRSCFGPVWGLGGHCLTLWKQRKNMFKVVGFFLNIFCLALQHNESSRRVFSNPVVG